MTAAHCCDKAQKVKIWTGQHRTDRWDSGEKVFWASSIHMHPDYDKRTFEHDVCILKVDDLEQGMDLSNNSVADFACLPSGDNFNFYRILEFKIVFRRTTDPRRYKMLDSWLGSDHNGKTWC